LNFKEFINFPYNLLYLPIPHVPTVTLLTFAVKLIILAFMVPIYQNMNLPRCLGK